MLKLVNVIKILAIIFEILAIIRKSEFIFIKFHTDRTRFPNARRFFHFQKQIKPSMERNFATYIHQMA